MMKSSEQTSFFQSESGTEQEQVWRNEIAERVAAHRARRGVGDDEPEPARHPHSRAQQLSEQALDRVRRRIEERMAREESERREREELARFFAEQRTLVTQPVVQPSTSSLAEGATTNVIEFPKGLVDVERASAKSAEDDRPADQLTIFEDVPEQAVFAEDLPPMKMPPLRLDTPLMGVHEELEPVRKPEFELPIIVAPFEVRAHAAAIDAGIVGACCMAFGAIFYGILHELPHSKAALGITAMTAFLIWTAYHVLFLAYCGATPGMTATNLAICDFKDEIPNARVRIYRAISLSLMCCSCGLGFLWTLLDEDRLGWHDRMTRTYPRQLAPE